MKDKIKARFNEFKNDPFSQGMLIGGAIGISSVIITGRIIGLNLDHKGVYIPDIIVNYMRESGETVMAHKENATIVLALVPEV